MARPLFLFGRIFGRLLVVGKEGNRWRCHCECGNFTNVMTNQLTGGSNPRRGTKSCGCLQRETVSRVNGTHHQTKTPEYGSWLSMMHRTGSPNHKQYHDYGGRGIMVCSRWRGDFPAFLEDMGPKPSKEYSLDRIDNEQGYNCGKCEDCISRSAAPNCRWATRREQHSNRRDNYWVTHQGRTQILAEWARELSMNPSVLLARLKKFGWTPEEALSVPVGTSRAQWRKMQDKGTDQCPN